MWKQKHTLCTIEGVSHANADISGCDDPDRDPLRSVRVREEGGPDASDENHDSRPD